jgi:murein DD-endopeptidase MepM/ murein hydrolase activator NlpD
MLAGLCTCFSLSACGGAGRAAPPHAGNGVYHHVKLGQTLWSIARTYDVDLKILVRTNRLSDRDVLRVGQRLLIPGARRQRQVVSRCPCPDQAAKSAVRTAKKSTSRSTSKQPVVASSSTIPIKLSWPILGTVTQHFSRNGPQRHDGIDIAAPKGSIIRAAAAGKVIFSDWGPGGYGRLVIVEHTANIVTVYAHNERNLVQRNQRVKQGQAIAMVGRSGRATGYHVHFEVRFKAVPKPPFPLLPQQDPAIIQSTHKLYATRGTT